MLPSSRDGDRATTIIHEVRTLLPTDQARFIGLLDIQRRPYLSSISVQRPSPSIQLPGSRITQIDDDYTFSLEENDLRALGEAWPKLINLSLIESPLPQDAVKGFGTSLTMLKVFAEYCPNLEKLGLFFVEEITLNFDGDQNPRHQLGRLRKLLVGSSIVPQGDIGQLGFLIGSLCSEDLTIEADNPWGTGQRETDRASEWQAALTLSKLVMKAKASVRKLEKKVADLEASSELLRGHTNS